MSDAQNALVIPVNVEDEMRESYIDYAMSVIVGRALPDVRDGLKPAHRRILYAMYREGLLSDKRYSKCAGVVGEVLKKYHPHGDVAVYDTLVRLAQDWNMRYPLIDGQGNFGSIDGDSPAAYRYTECRMSKLAEEMLADIDKDTVDFMPNFDGSTEEPVVLPTRFPNLLLNGSEGIAVGMATKIPPHNLGELVDGLVALIDTPTLSVRQLMKYIPGPDFPTGGIICGRKGIEQAYETGRGPVVMRGKVTIEDIKKGDRQAIIIEEVPYQVNKAKLLERIAELVREGKIEGISELRDESDREGLRVVIELKKGSIPGVILNQLYKHTPLQSSFGIIFLSIVQNRPRILNLREMLAFFLDHRREVILRRTHFDLRRAEERAHILEGLKIAVEHIDEVIALIKKSQSPEEAKAGLIKRFALSEIQAQAILDMRLQRLTGLEREKIVEEYQAVLKLIAELKEILKSPELVKKMVKEELKEIKKQYADARRSHFEEAAEEMRIEDLIQKEDMVVTLSHAGYIKRSPLELYQAQGRGGKGKTGMTTKEEDFVEELFVASTHDTLLIFTNRGKVYWLKVHSVPEAGRATRGKSIANLVQFASGERISGILPIAQFEEGKNVIFMTKRGIVKKTELMAFSNPRVGGIIAIAIDDGDEVIGAKLTDGKQDIFLASAQGQSIRFLESEARVLGRTARGVKAIELYEGDGVVSFEVLNPSGEVLTVSENGYGKRTELAEHRVQGRGGSGIVTLKCTDKTGPVIACLQVDKEDEVMIVTNAGKIIRLAVRAISLYGRATQGVRLISLDRDEKVVSVTKVREKDEEASNKE